MNAVCEIIISLQLNISLLNDRKNAQHLDFTLATNYLSCFVCFFFLNLHSPGELLVLRLPATAVFSGLSR